MAHSKSALKRWRQNERHRERNKSVRSGARSAVKAARVAIGDGAGDDARRAIAEASGVLDRASKGNVVHRNAAARHKSRLMRALNRAEAAAAVPAEAAPKKTTRARASTAAKPRTTRSRAKAE